MKPIKIPRVSGTICLLTLALIASPSAVADDSGWYLGGNIGLSSAEIDDERIIGGLLGAGLTTTSIEDDDQDLGYKLFGGYQFNRYLALEGGYFNLGEFGYEATTEPPGTLSGNLKLQGINLDIIGFLPITENFSAFGRGGVNYAEAKSRFAGTGAVNVLDPSRSERAANYKFGLGLQYDFTRHFGMRAEAERYRINDTIGNKGDIDLYSAGLVFRFGSEPPPRPAPRAEPPPPPPVVVAPPPPRQLPMRVTFSADALFDFDQSSVKPTGRQDLDKLAMDLSGTDFEIIRVTGHTDRIGSHDYNMRLSTQRAEAVKAYLVESGGIPAGRIAARGENGANPVTRPGECTGREKPRASPELIACLQPDRRVEVEVSGTK